MFDDQQGLSISINNFSHSLCNAKPLNSCAIWFLSLQVMKSNFKKSHAISLNPFWYESWSDFCLIGNGKLNESFVLFDKTIDFMRSALHDNFVCKKCHFVSVLKMCNVSIAKDMSWSMVLRLQESLW